MTPRILLLALAAALPLAAAAAPQSSPRTGPPTMHHVTVQPPRAMVEVSCQSGMWPTQRQVARYTGLDEADAAPVRRDIVRQGRRACWRGATHVQVTFAEPAQAVAVARP